MLRRERGKVHAIGQYPVALSLPFPTPPSCVWNNEWGFQKGEKVVKKAHCAHAAHHRPSSIDMFGMPFRIAVKYEPTHVGDEFL